MLQYIIILSIIAVSIIYIAYNFYKVKSLGEGTEKMRNMAKIIRDGANEFMKTESLVCALRLMQTSEQLKLRVKVTLVTPSKLLSAEVQSVDYLSMLLVYSDLF